MEIDENKKILIDKTNRYLVDDRDVVVFLNTDEDFETLKKYDDKEYSIKGNFISSDKKESLILVNYRISKAKHVKYLKDSNKLKMFALDKLKIKSSKKGGIIVLNFEKIATKNRVRYIRQELGITQKELAEKVNVSRKTISSLENGFYNPSLELAHKIRVALDCSAIEEVFKFY